MPIARPTATSSSGRYSAGKPKLMPHSRSPRAMTKTPATGPRARGDRRAALAADEVWTGRPVEVDRNRRGRVLLRLELLDRVDDRGGGVADRGCDLARQLRTDVARRIQAGKAGLHRRIRHQEAERIVLHVVAVIEELDVRLEADEDEDPGHRQRPSLLGRHILEGDLRNLAILALDFRDDGVRQQLDFRVLAGRFDQNRLGAELLPAVNDVDLLGIAGQKDAFLERGIAAADHGDHLLLEEGAVTDRALRHTASLELTFARNAELLGLAARGQDDEVAGVLAVLGFDHLPVASPMDGGDAGR